VLLEPEGTTSNYCQQHSYKNIEQVKSSVSEDNILQQESFQNKKNGETCQEFMVEDPNCILHVVQVKS